MRGDFRPIFLRDGLPEGYFVQMLASAISETMVRARFAAYGNQDGILRASGIAEGNRRGVAFDPDDFST